MEILTVTLLADGQSDRALLPIIDFLLDEHCRQPHRVQFAFGLHAGALSSRLRSAVQLYPCDLLLVHRDAESAPVEDREREIVEACRSIEPPPHFIKVIPVRMTESWLLIDEAAIYGAVGNPNGQNLISLPPIAQLERLPDPKQLLFSALADAKGVGSNRRRKFKPEQHRNRVSELIEDYSPLRALPSFRHFEDQIIAYACT